MGAVGAVVLRCLCCVGQCRFEGWDEMPTAAAPLLYRVQQQWLISTHSDQWPCAAPVPLVVPYCSCRRRVCLAQPMLEWLCGVFVHA